MRRGARMLYLRLRSAATMNTPTHFLMTAALRKALPDWEIPRSAVYLGAVAPDVPLYLLSFGGLAYYQAGLGWTGEAAARHIFGTLYFRDPWWIALHNALHSPLSLLAGLALTAMFTRRRLVAARWCTWFLAACLLHSIVDIFTHYDDGPVLFWPLNWNFRFSSPVSYWDHQHYGSQVAILELLLDLALVAYMVGPWIARKVRGFHAVAP